ncbi:MAG: PKD domain-containing protein [Bacteroidia bacterium]
MKNFTGIIYITLVCMGLVWSPFRASAQNCGANTPSFTIDLTGSPDSIWTSTSVKRADTCCGASAPDVCIEFVVTLDSLSYAIKLELIAGALPPGALFYQVGCGPQVPIGTQICLNSVGPHRITFCKPGNNENVYQLSAIQPPSSSPDIIVSEGCRGVITASGFEPSSIVWKSVGNDSLHNSFLDCQAGCDTVNVKATPGYPAFVDYEVCGIPLGGCSSINICDTTRVYFVSDLTVNILPDSPAVCFGGTPVTLKAVVTGGKAPYTYIWSTGSTDSSIMAGLGTYQVQVSDQTNCPAVATSIFVDSFSVPIRALPGNDTLICSGSQGIALNGRVEAAAGGIWSGGQGTFSPNRTALNAVYSPSSTEMASGQVTLTLTTTGNKTCPADSQQMQVTISQTPEAKLLGSTAVCEAGIHTYSSAQIPGNQYRWQVIGGQFLSDSTGDTVQVEWGSAGTGQLTLTETNAAGCDTTVTRAITIFSKPLPQIIGPPEICENTSIAAYSVKQVAGYSYSWEATNGSILSGNGTFQVSVDWGTTGNGTLSVTVTNPTTGCKGKTTLPVQIYSSPVAAIKGNTLVCSFSNGNMYSVDNLPNTSYFWSVSKGTVQQGIGTNEVGVGWTSSGEGEIAVYIVNDITGCDTTLKLPVKIIKTAAIAPADTSGCVNFEVRFNGQGDSTTVKYLWEFGNGQVSNQQHPVVSYTQPGKYRVMLIAENANGCRDTAYSNVEAFPAPTAHFDIIFEDDEQYLMATEDSLRVRNNTVDAQYYLWDFGDLSLSSIEKSPAHIYDTVGVYYISLRAENEFGCADTFSRFVRVRVPSDIIAPNAFSPNGNGTNDYFSIASYNIESLSLIIFNRWGQIVFSTDEKDFKWDGTINGQPAEEEVYGYYVEARDLNGETHRKKGTITILR